MANGMQSAHLMASSDEAQTAKFNLTEFVRSIVATTLAPAAERLADRVGARFMMRVDGRSDWSIYRLCNGEGESKI